MRAKVQHRAPEVRIEPETYETPKVINIMAALKKSMQAKGRENVRDAVRKRIGKRSAEQFSPKTRTTSTAKKIDAAPRDPLSGELGGTKCGRF